MPGGSQHPVLREVDVGVDEAGKYERASVVVDRERAEALREARRVAAPGDATIRGNCQRPPTVVTHCPSRPDLGGVSNEGHDGAPDDPLSRWCTHHAAVSPVVVALVAAFVPGLRGPSGLRVSFCGSAAAVEREPCSGFRSRARPTAVRRGCAAGLSEAGAGASGDPRLHSRSLHSPRMVRGSHSASSGQNRTAARPMTWRAMNGHMA